jgi:hypothetical protein
VTGFASHKPRTYIHEGVNARLELVSAAAAAAAAALETCLHKWCRKRKSTHGERCVEVSTAEIWQFEQAIDVAQFDRQAGRTVCTRMFAGSNDGSISQQDGMIDCQMLNELFLQRLPLR